VMLPRHSCLCMPLDLPGCVCACYALPNCWLLSWYSCAAVTATAAAVVRRRTGEGLCWKPGCKWSVVIAAHPVKLAAAGAHLQQMLLLHAEVVAGPHLQCSGR
jgi:hypothetical protein